MGTGVYCGPLEVLEGAFENVTNGFSAVSICQLGWRLLCDGSGYGGCIWRFC